MSSFVKIYGSILRSSVWQQPLATKVVWITMLALADVNGVVEASIPGLAAIAGVSLEECEAALQCFLSPDRYSSSKIDEGRRIRERRGGWTVTNHNYYRELQTEKQARDAARMAQARAARLVANTSDMSPTSRDVLANTDPDLNTNTDLKRDPDPERAHARVLEPEPPSSPTVTEIRPLPPPAGLRRVRPEHAENAPQVWRTIKDWDPPKSLEDEAVMFNISREYFRLRVTRAKNKPIGGRDGVLDREQWVRDQFPFWVVDQRAQPARAAAPRGPPSPLPGRPMTEILAEWAEAEKTEEAKAVAARNARKLRQKPA